MTEPQALDIELTRFNNPTVDSAVLLAPVTSQRRLTYARVSKWYTKEEREALTSTYKPQSDDTRFAEDFNKLEKAQRKKRMIHRFSALEDEFIRKNYKHLPDKVIALALNLPVNKILSRRHILGLKKVRTSANTVLVVWNNRDKFEEDVKNKNLTLLRAHV